MSATFATMTFWNSAITVFCIAALWAWFGWRRYWLLPRHGSIIVWLSWIGVLAGRIS